MSWYTALKTAMPYDIEQICPRCTAGLLVDFTHEKGNRFQAAPYFVGQCPACGCYIRFHDTSSLALNSLAHSSADEISKGDYLMDLHDNVPEVLVAIDDDRVGTGHELTHPIGELSYT